MTETRAEQIARRAQALPPEQRGEFVAAECAGDPALRALVDALLRDADTLVHARGARGTAPSPGPTAGPDRIGPYRILETLGEGGMGTVYLAEQREPVRRRVALKVIKLGMDTRQVLARFELERQALALMNHDCIARVFDAGRTERGQPFFVMEHVPGIPITDYCDKHKLSLGERIALFRQVCQGVQHAHQKGVIHRDLKPGNVLVVRDGDRAVPKIIDFGLARATDRHLTAVTVFTEQGQIFGTPEYMSPEQADLDAESIDTRTDVYSLGVMLYEILSGRLPFTSKELRQAGWHEIRRTLREVEPPKPSTKLTTLGPDSTALAQARRTSLAALLRELRGDLDWIVLKAIAKEPERRYDSAASLGADLERYLGHEPVLAGPPTLGYRMRKFAQRYRGEVVAAAIVLATLLAGLGGTAYGFVNAERERARAQQSLDDFDRLALVVRLRAAIDAERELYPPDPPRIAPIEAWLSSHAEPLVAAIDGLRQALHGLERAPEHRGATRLEADAFLRDRLHALLADLEQFAAPGDGLVARVRERLRWARSVHRLSIEDHAARWSATCDAIARSPRYGGLRIAPIVGLVPLGADPHSGLFEFVHLASAEPDRAIPTRGANASLALDEADGIVLVLIPGGRDVVGAQRDDPARPNHYERAEPDERWEEVDVAPFLLSKFELTQAQWRRLSGGEIAAFYKAGETHFGATIGWTHPVEQVSWLRCTELCRQHGLVLPTQTQWEYACRAGTDTPWSTGGDASSLQNHANLGDHALEQRVPPGYRWGKALVPWDDGHVLHAPVGSFLPNGFGLFDMHGNVWEWARDAEGYAEIESRAVRGGDYRTGPHWTRSAYRQPMPQQASQSNMGMRPAMELPAPRPR